jgi:uncharacterized membrane protein YvbJ
MYCSQCGELTDDDSKFCAKCGNAIGQTVQTTPVSAVKDESNTGLNIISFLIPIIGVVLYIIYHEKEPIKAKGVGKWTIISVVIGIVFWIIYVAIIASSSPY